MIKFIGNGGHAAVCREIPTWHHSSPNNWTFIAVGDNADRKKESLSARRPFAVLIHPGAVISPTAIYGQGCVFMPGAVVQAHAHIGEHVILNTGCTVDHHCVLEDYVHIAPGAHICGNVVVGEGALVGVGVGIEPGVKIPAWSIVKRIPYEISLQRN